MFYILERLFFFLFVFSIIRSVFQFVFRVRRAAQGSRPQPQAKSPGPASTLLHQDPVCGTYVAADSSLKRIFDGKVVHFCSPECRDRYRA
jgi:YHS domain-containing protein